MVLLIVYFSPPTPHTISLVISGLHALLLPFSNYYSLLLKVLCPGFLSYSRTLSEFECHDKSWFGFNQNWKWTFLFPMWMERMEQTSLRLKDWRIHLMTYLNQFPFPFFDRCILGGNGMVSHISKWEMYYIWSSGYPICPFRSTCECLITKH